MELQDHVKGNINGETWEVTHYLAMAYKADHLGMGEVADALRRIAMDEANHGARFIFLDGQVEDLKGEIEKMLAGERKAYDGKHDGMKEALGHDKKELASWFDTAAHDEDRHAKILDGILNKYFK
ncbi:MAG: rubrerythrin family protein [Thermaerobacter sp.]|jgi:rubrerythrin|nr:rubrerythrin family protein [Thermaerobacter sp.]MDA8144893.1 rubrerythrin family protein [Thermaerobacter sp.]